METKPVNLSVQRTVGQLNDILWNCQQPSKGNRTCLNNRKRYNLFYRPLSCIFKKIFMNPKEKQHISPLKNVSEDKYSIHKFPTEGPMKLHTFSFTQESYLLYGKCKVHMKLLKLV